MKKRLLSFTAMSFLLVAFVLAFAPVVSAGGVDDKIQALESELSRLKSEQMELKKEAVAAAAALPTFSWRPRSGVTMEAADRSWAITMFLQNQIIMYNFSDAQDRGGLSTGDLFIRRFRPGWTLCVMDCLYEWHQTWDIDTGDIGNNQNSGFYMNFSKVNPWLPDIFIGDEDSLLSYSYVTRSSTSSAQAELAADLLSDSAVSNLSRRNIGLAWRGKPLVLLPGNWDLGLEYHVGSGMVENTVSDTDRKEFAGIIGATPFSRSKNPWLQRLKLGLSTTISSVDSRSGVQGRRLRVRTDERNGRLTLLDANGIGDGIHHNLQGGIEWGYAFYTFRAELGLSKYHSGEAGKPAVGAAGTTGLKNVKGGYWRLGNEFFLWSPKGLLTGGAYQPGTVQFGWGFQRTQAGCVASNPTGLTATAVDCDPGLRDNNVDGDTNDAGENLNDFNSVRLLKRELNLWYYWNSFARIGFYWNWWDADNVPRGSTAATALQRNLGCTRNRSEGTTTGTGTTGKGCDWHSFNLALQVYF